MSKIWTTLYNEALKVLKPKQISNLIEAGGNLHLSGGFK